MTQILEPSTTVAAESSLCEIPAVPSWAVARERLFDRLDLGVSGLVTAVTGPSGSGKTTLIASWLAVREPADVIWLSEARMRVDPNSVLRLLAEALAGRGVFDAAQIPSAEARTPRRGNWLVSLAAALRRTGPWVVVLDGFPRGRQRILGQELETLMGEVGRSIRLIVSARGVPALDLHRHRAAGELTAIDAADLVLSREEIAAVLAQHGMRVNPGALSAIEERTHGWASGVRFAALSLQGEESLDAAMRRTDELTADYLQHEVLMPLDPFTRDQIVRTSVVDELRPALAHAILGHDLRLSDDVVAGSDAFVAVDNDTSVSLHPLLRAAAVRWFEREAPHEMSSAQAAAARWYAEQGVPVAAVRLATSAHDWTLAGKVAIDELVVASVFVGVESDVLRAVARDQAILSAHPLLSAAVAAADGHIEVAEATLSGWHEQGQAGAASLPEAMSAALIELAIARARGDADMGTVQLSRARDLLTRLPLSHRTRSVAISRLLDAHDGALEAWRGDLAVARARLSAGAGADAAPTGPYSPAELDSLSMLAVLEALDGHLGLASDYVETVEHWADGDSRALQNAALARGWIHLHRDELAAAQACAVRQAGAARGRPDPWLTIVRQVLTARLATATGMPESALRAVASVRTGTTNALPGWLSDLVAAEEAEAHIAAGDPRAALAAVTTVADPRRVASALLRAEAVRMLGDRRGALFMLSASAPHLGSASLDLQVRARLLRVHLGLGDCSPAETRGDVEWALRNAARELFRRPVLREFDWLVGVVERDAGLRREYAGFLRGVRQPDTAAGRRIASVVARSGELLVDPLTQREIEVLERLAEMQSTEEIAADLFVSANTVKSHLKSLFRKFGVNRRAEAVRKGRSLGLC